MAENNRRPPTNMVGLMQLAIENTTPNNTDNQDGSTTTPMDPERRQWLEEALIAMSTNVVEDMRKCIETISDTNEDVSEQEKALDIILKWVDNVDFANDFEKIGGFNILQPGLQNPHAGIRRRIAELVAELMQNNPYCQEKASDMLLIPILIDVLDNDEDSSVRIKALYALSCLLRHNELALKEFQKCDGFSSLLRAMQSNVERLTVKASFLISCLCTQQPSIKDALCSMGFIVQLVALIQREHEPAHEHLLSALYSLVCEHEASVHECQRPDLRLEEILQDRIQLLNGREESLEEVEYCQQLLDVCFNRTSDEDNDGTLR